MKNPEAKYHISEDFFDKTLQSYLEKSDVKKIDAGGGMIHGEVVDFANDPSEKLILAHSSLPFSEEQLASACTAEFGTSDLRVPLDHETFFQDKALQWLRQRFPSLKKEELRELITEQTEEIPRGNKIFTRLQEAGYIPLLLTGRVELNGLLYPAGTLLGEANALADLQELQEMAAVGPVRILPISLDLYRGLLKKHKLLKKRISLLKDCDHFRTFPIFQYGLTDDYLISVIKKSERISLKKNQTVSLPENTLGVLEVGEVQFLTGNKNLKVTENTVLGLSNMLGKSLSWKEKTLKKSQVLCLPAENLLQAPVVRWCLQRAYQNYHFRLS